MILHPRLMLDDKHFTMDIMMRFNADKKIGYKVWKSMNVKFNSQVFTLVIRTIRIKSRGKKED